MPVEDMFIQPAESGDAATTQQTTEGQAQPAEQTTAPEQTATTVENQKQPDKPATEEKSYKYFQTKYQEEVKARKALEAKLALMGQSETKAPAQPQESTEDGDYEAQLIQKITKSIVGEINSTLTQKEQEAQLEKAVSDIEAWAKENELSEIMPDIYERFQKIDAPLKEKVELMKLAALGIAGQSVVHEVQRTAEAKAEQKLERKLLQTSPKGATVPPSGEKSKEQKELEAALALENINPAMMTVFGGERK